jgi:DNA invertase Pin-like site-specific DNA recombinase
MIVAGRADVLLCWRVDRFVRRIADLETVIQIFEMAGAKQRADDGRHREGRDGSQS